MSKGTAEDHATLKREIAEEIGAARDLLHGVARALYERPEIGGEEQFAVARLTTALADAGFTVERGVAGLATAFVGTASSEQAHAPAQGSGTVAGPGRPMAPRVGIVFEYDALPDFGHACGHNASAAASLGASIALAKVLRRHGLRGECVALGTPAEESFGGKIPMAEAGVFDGLAAAMMVHSFDRWVLDVRAMAMDALQFTFQGKAVHGVFAQRGVNALDAVLLTFNAINCLRQQMLETNRVHGIVTRGGDAPNTVPDHTRAQVYVRALESEELQTLTARVEKCAQAGALATGCSVEIDRFEPHYDHVASDPRLVDLFHRNLATQVTEQRIDTAPEPISSTDMGNVSQLVPAIHPLMAVATPGVQVHTRDFAAETVTARALEAITAAAYAMACTGLDVIVGAPTGR
jgi:amidohydrolase